MELNPFCYSHVYNPDTEPPQPPSKLPNTVSTPKFPERDTLLPNDETKGPVKPEPHCEGR